VSKAKESTEEELNRTYQLGQSSGLEEAAGFILQRATECFERGDDVLADRLRGYAKVLKSEAGKRHPGERA
jgi:hypothetical protein